MREGTRLTWTSRDTRWPRSKSRPTNPKNARCVEQVRLRSNRVADCEKEGRGGRRDNHKSHQPHKSQFDLADRCAKSAIGNPTQRMCTMTPCSVCSGGANEKGGFRIADSGSTMICMAK